MKDFTLPKEFTENWLKVLRSGEYRQKDSTLIDHIEYPNDEESYSIVEPKGGCCLGIAMLTCNIDPLNLAGSGMPSEVRFLLKGTDYPSVLVDNNEDDNQLVNILAHFNDGFHFEKLEVWEKRYPNTTFPQRRDDQDITQLTFDEISDWIEKNVELV